MTKTAPKTEQKAKKPSTPRNIVARLPEALRTAPVMRKSAIKPHGATKYQREMMLLFMPELTKMFFAQLHAGMLKGDQWSKNTWAEMANYVQRAKGNVNIFNTNLQATKSDGPALRYSMDQIVRELAAQSEDGAIDTTAVTVRE